MENKIPNEWIVCSDRLPPDGELVESKIDDRLGKRNEVRLKRSGRLWFVPDGSIYVYYTPTHWRPIAARANSGEG
jgi:hypothetical protein